MSQNYTILSKVCFGAQIALNAPQSIIEKESNGTQTTKVDTLSVAQVAFTTEILIETFVTLDSP